MTASEYLAQKVNYGGEWVSIGDLYARYGDNLAASWLCGYLAAKNEVRP